MELGKTLGESPPRLPLEGITVKLQDHTGRVFLATTCVTGYAGFIDVWSGWCRMNVRSPGQWDPPRQSAYLTVGDLVVAVPFVQRSDYPEAGLVGPQRLTLNCDQSNR